MPHSSVISIRPQSSIFSPQSSIFSLYFHTPGSSGIFWTTAETLEDAYSICRKYGRKILWISHDPWDEVLSVPEDSELTWQPSLTREQVKTIYGSLESYCKFLPGGNQRPAQPKNLEDLLQFGILFGGQCRLAPAIKEKLANNEELLFENYNGFSMLIEPELGKAYVAYRVGITVI